MEVYVDHADRLGETWKNSFDEIADDARVDVDEMMYVVCEYFRTAHVNTVVVDGRTYEVHVDLLETKE